jgi:serine/threonine protein kinase
VSNTDETQPSPTPPNSDPNATLARPDAAPPGALVIPGYDLQPEIARGGMGVVYAARDIAFDREVAIKVMLPGMDKAAFLREARITGRLPHPGIPPVYALGELPDGRPFLAMKLIRGDTLDKVLKARTDLSADRGKLLAAFEQMCHAVGYAHAQGLIHRDLKPSNVMVGAFGEVQVMDWGLAREVDSGQQAVGSEEQSNAITTPDASDDALKTVAGQIKGTPAYMAPEQARGEPVDARADVFALGGILAAILTGHPPFAGNSVLETILRASQAELGETLDRLDATGADAELLALCKKCLAAKAADRHTNATELAQAVAAYRAEVEARLLQAERDHAAVKERRKRRRVQLGLAISVGLLILMGGGGAAVGSMYFKSEENRAEALKQRNAADLAREEAALQKGAADEAKSKAIEARNLSASIRSGRAAAFSPDGSRIITGGDDGAVRVWSAKTGTELLTLGGHKDSVQDVSFSTDGQRAISGSLDNTIRVWDATTGALELTIKVHTQGVRVVSFSADGTRVLSVSFDQTVGVWDAHSGNQLLTLRHTGSVNTAGFSPDGARVLSASSDGTAVVWDAKTGVDVFRLKMGARAK